MSAEIIYLHGLLTRPREIKVAKYWPSFSCAFMDWGKVQVNKHENTRTRPRSSNFDLASLVNKRFIILKRALLSCGTQRLISCWLVGAILPITFRDIRFILPAQWVKHVTKTLFTICVVLPSSLSQWVYFLCVFRFPLFERLTQGDSASSSLYNFSYLSIIALKSLCRSQVEAVARGHVRLITTRVKAGYSRHKRQWFRDRGLAKRNPKLVAFVILFFSRHIEKNKEYYNYDRRTGKSTFLNLVFPILETRKKFPVAEASVIVHKYTQR